MMYKLTLIAAAVLCSASASDAVRELQYGGDLTPRNITPTFDHGYLAVYEMGGAASIYSREGALQYKIAKPENGSIDNVAVDEDGASAIAVDFATHGAIAVIDASGALSARIDTAKYVPSFVSFAPDHSIWSIGRPSFDSIPGAPDFQVLRHFNRDGQQLGEFLPRSSFNMKREPVTTVVGMWGLRIAKNRIGMILDPTGADRTWLEADMNGKEIGRWTAGFDGHPAAFTASGAVYARTTGGMLMLDHGTGLWNPIPAAEPGALLGADGNALVFKIRGQNRVVWMLVP